MSIATILASPSGSPATLDIRSSSSRTRSVRRSESARSSGRPISSAQSKTRFQYDRKVLIEAACEGRELECAVLGNDRPEASTIGEMIVKGRHEFYSYESKYVDPDGAQIRIPADLPRAVSERIRALAVAAFKALSIRGMARVDFLARADLSEVYVNEVNTIPGFTSISHVSQALGGKRPAAAARWSIG